MEALSALINEGKITGDLAQYVLEKVCHCIKNRYQQLLLIVE